MFEGRGQTAKAPQNTGRHSLSAREFIPLVLRAGVAFCFYGHGTFGFLYKESRLPFFPYFGISRESARLLEFVIRGIDPPAFQLPGRGVF